MCVFSGHCHRDMEFLRETCPPSTQGGEKSCSPDGSWVEPPIWQNIFDKAWIMGPRGGRGENHPQKFFETRNHHHLVQDTPHLTSWPIPIKISPQQGWQTHLWKARRSSFWTRGHIHNGHGEISKRKREFSSRKKKTPKKKRVSKKLSFLGNVLFAKEVWMTKKSSSEDVRRVELCLLEFCWNLPHQSSFHDTFLWGH